MSPHTAIRRATVAGALLVFAACTGDVLAPAHQPAGAASTASHDAATVTLRGVNDHASAAATAPTPVACSTRKTIQSSGVFGPGGGTLAFGSSRLVIPGGALRDTVTITASQVDDGTSTVRFEPHGLRFYKPAGLVLDGSSCALPSDQLPAVVYVDDDGNVLETIDAYYDPHWQTVAAPIQHFSGYAIAFRDER